MRSAYGESVSKLIENARNPGFFVEVNDGRQLPRGAQAFHSRIGSKRYSRPFALIS